MKRFFFTLCSLLICHAAVDASFVYRAGTWDYVSVPAMYSADEHHRLGMEAYGSENFAEAATQLRILTENYPSNPLADDAYFFLGMSYFQTGDYEMANIALNSYLKRNANPTYLTEAVNFKFSIADAFRCGERARLFGYRKCPKWMNGRDLAVTIYDEVIAALPSSDLAARALFAKGSVLCDQQDFRCSIEAFSTLIRRFPKHELTPDSYLAIDQVYLCQAELEFQNPDILVLAELNLLRFRGDFPNDDRVQEAEAIVQQIEELYAWGFYNTGCFFERICKPQSAALYYSSACCQFPDTRIAERCRERIAYLAARHPNICVPEEEASSEQPAAEAAEADTCCRKDAE